MKTSKLKIQSSGKIQENNSQTRTFDLEERMSRFGEKTVVFCRNLSPDHVSRPIISQLVRSATSVGANYAEAINASSKRDFRNKVHIAKKEAQETKHWLRMLKPCYQRHEEEINILRQEAHELTLMLQSMINKLDKKVEV